MVTAYRRHLLVASAAVLVTLSIWIFYRQQLQSARTSEQGRPEFQGFFNFATNAHSPPQPDFVELATDALFYEVHNLGAIQSMCLDKNWTAGLVFTCDKSFGGLGNIRNSILNCVRYAIEAGAELVVPQIRLRNPNDLFDFKTETKVNLNYLFDEDYFVSALKHSCPQLKIHSTLEDVPNMANARDPVNLTPEELENDPPMTGLARPAQWRCAFLVWLHAWAKREYGNISFASPTIIALDRSYLQFPVYYDGAAFVRRFGHLLRFRADLHIFAAKALHSLATTYGEHIDPTVQINRHAYLGAHLRTESDTGVVWKGRFKYSTYEEQSVAYLAQAVEANTSVIYVASGDQNEVMRLTADAVSAHGFKVTNKYLLLQGEDLQALQALTWDQQAVVDYLMLLRASAFAGVAHSSFSWNIALQRHLFSDREDHLEGKQVMEDEFSIVYGSEDDYEVPKYPACMWP